MAKETKHKDEKESEEEAAEAEEKLHDKLIEEADAREKSKKRKRGPYRKSSVGGRTRL